MSAAPSRQPSRTAFVLAFTSIYIIWGSTYLGIRVAVETIPPFLMGACRFLLAGTVLFFLIQRTAPSWPTARQWRDNAFVGAFLLLGGNGFVSWAEQTLPSGLTALIIGIQPVFMVLTEWAWPGGHHPGKTTLVGLLLGFAGVAYLAAPWQSSASTGANFPAVMLLLLACAMWAFGSIWSRHIKNPAPPFQASAMQMLGGSAGLYLAALVHGEFASLKVSSISGHSLGAFFYLAFIGSLVGFSTFVWLMKHTTPARVSTYAYVNPVVAVFLGWLVLNEPITPHTMISAVIIVAAVVIITTQKGRSANPAPKQTAQPITLVQPSLGTKE